MCRFAGWKTLNIKPTEMPISVFIHGITASISMRKLKKEFDKDVGGIHGSSTEQTAPKHR